MAFQPIETAPALLRIEDAAEAWQRALAEAEKADAEERLRIVEFYEEAAEPDVAAVKLSDGSRRRIKIFNRWPRLGERWFAWEDFEY